MMSEKEEFSLNKFEEDSDDSQNLNKDSIYYKLIQAHHQKEKEKEEKTVNKPKNSMFKNIIRREKTPEYIDFEHRVKKIKIILKRGKKLMKKDVYAAIAMYSALQPLYNDLPDQFKKKIYPKIKPFYKELEKKMQSRNQNL